MQKYTFPPLSIDYPQTKIVTWVYDTKIHNEKSVSRNGLHTLNVLALRGFPMGAFYRSRTNNLSISIQNVGLETISIIMKTLTRFTTKI